MNKPDPVEKIAKQRREYAIRRIHRDFYGRVAKETNREIIDKDFMEIADWFASLPTERTMIPNIVITGGDYIQRMQFSYAIFATLMKNHGDGLVDVERARTIIHDHKWRQQSVRLQGVMFLIIHDVELFEECYPALDSLALSRYQNGCATIFVGKKVTASDVLAPLLRKGLTKVICSESGIEASHEHGFLPNERRFG